MNGKPMYISFIMARRKEPYSIDSKVFSRIVGHRGGWVFTPADFAGIGHHEAVNSALQRLRQKEKILRIARGLYHQPKHHPLLGDLAPTTSQIVDAIKRANNIRVQPSGAYAANLLGLSEQVPLRTVLLTDGLSKILQIGRQRIEFRKTTSKVMACSDRVSGLVIQALKYLGKDHVDDAVIDMLSKRLTAKDRATLLDDTRYAPAWIAEIMRTLAQAEEPHC